MPARVSDEEKHQTALERIDRVRNGLAELRRETRDDEVRLAVEAARLRQRLDAGGEALKSALATIDGARSGLAEIRRRIDEGDERSKAVVADLRRILGECVASDGGVDADCHVELEVARLRRQLDSFLSGGIDAPVGDDVDDGQIGAAMGYLRLGLRNYVASANADVAGNE